MALQIRSLITQKIIQSAKYENLSIDRLNQISSALQLKNTKTPELHLSITDLKELFPKSSSSIIDQILSTKFPENTIQRTNFDQTTKQQKIIFQLENNNFISKVLASESSFYKSEIPQKVVVEFSSPNIAKPFHVGHLRSTIIGNFISKLFSELNNDVVKINYLGDWGTQFGLLKVGIDVLNLSDEEISKNPIQSLFKAYVKANSLAEVDPEIAEKARSIFRDLENGESAFFDKWKIYRQYTVDELKIIYQRLGVEFDKYDWESMYGQKEIQSVLKLLEEFQLLKEEIDGRKIVEVGDRRVPIVKSDGTTLYLTRDIAAGIDRFSNHNFDKMFYVVDNGQSDHFISLFEVNRKLKREYSERTKHVKFGRVNGMSTRKGNVVFLKDILDEAKDIMLQKQIESPNTRIDLTKIEDNTADILGVTAVIINDLKQRRQRDYIFDWNKALQVNGDTGIKLQYTHCRLCSLTKTTGVKNTEFVEPKLLAEIDAVNLIHEIARFPEIVYRTQTSLEACILVNYLFGLCNSISRAMKTLNIKNESSQAVQEHRMLLFNSSRKVLYQGMIMLGLQPLEEM